MNYDHLDVSASLMSNIKSVRFHIKTQITYCYSINHLMQIAR